MKRYEMIADEVSSLIDQGVLGAGERLLSVRKMSMSKGVSISTVLQAYLLLEQKGLIISRPQSGYYVANISRLSPVKPLVTRPRLQSTAVDIGELVFELMTATKNRSFSPLGSPFPSPELYPLKKLNQYTHAISDYYSPWESIAALTPGNEALRMQIVKRYVQHGYSISLEDVTITSGALEAIRLSLQAVCQPGDTVIVESPCVYAILQGIELLGLKVIEMTTSSADGVDIGLLAKVIGQNRIAACLLMPNFQNPLGSLMPDDKKQAIVELLAKHDIPLIEDDVCQELYFGSKRPKSTKYFDKKGLVLHCSSFSKSLAPGYQVGWVIAGKFQNKVNQLKCMSTLVTPSLLQKTIADYLTHENYDRHLRKLRHSLAIQQAQAVHLIDRYFPKETVITKPKGGYTLWLKLPKSFNTLDLFYQALEKKIIIAPGCLFSARDYYNDCLRINYGYAIDNHYKQAIKTLSLLLKK